MKIQPRGPLASGATPVPLRAANSGSAAAQPRSIADTATIQGLSQTDLQPHVRAAIEALMAEVDRLRRELEQSKRRVAQLERLADQDTLLPVANRRAFVRELTRAMSFAERYGSPGAVLYFDLNQLKKVNDQHGHAAGDAALRRVAEILTENVRASDVVGRLGGDEFGVILAQCEPATAHEKAASLAELIATDDMRWEGHPVRLGAAVGIYCFSGTEQPHDALDAADKAMYRHKRDVVGVAGP